MPCGSIASSAADDWLLYAIDSPNAGNARGMGIGRIFNRSGQLVASVAQEGLIRYLPFTREKRQAQKS